jgi:O-antigen/teichoic acid export membrane protein
MFERGTEHVTGTRRRLQSRSVTEARGRPSAAGNAAISLVGAFAPALVALVAIPGLVHALGAELFGLLSFIWIVFGTFAVLDFGTGRATTKFVAELLARERNADIPALFWSASAINLAVGLFCGVLLFVLAPWFSPHIMKLPASLQPTAIAALRLTAIALPFVILGGVFRSALEGLQRFDLSNAVQLPVSALNYIAPLIVARAGASLPWVVASVCVTRVCAVPPLLMLCRQQLPMLGRPHIERRELRRLVQFGSWLTVSNVVGPLLLSLDRLFVGSILGARALGLYAPVYELVTRLSLIPASVMAALFPAFSMLTDRSSDDIRRAMRRAQRLLALLMLPVMIVGVSFAPIILQLWLGTAQTSASVAAMQLLLIGVVALSMGAVPFTLVQALGKPKWSAIIHVIELPIHAAVTWWAVSSFGVVGAAGAWSLRALYDAGLFDAAVTRMIGRREVAALELSIRVTGTMVVGAAILSTLAAWAAVRPTPLALSGALTVLTYAVVAWHWALESSEREAVLWRLRRGAPRDGSSSARESVTEPVRDSTSTL